MTNSIIESISINCKECELTKPYVLSFDTIKSLVSIQVEIKLKNGNDRRAETVPLPGYSDETKESILNYLYKVVPNLLDKPIEEARRIVAQDISKCPFACSPLLTALDLFSYKPAPFNPTHIDFVVPFTSSNLLELGEFIKSLPPNSSRTVKIKLTGRLEDDLRCLIFLETLNLQFVFIRFDANQAFNYTNASIYYQALSSCNYLDRVHYVEQPMHTNAWKDHAELVKAFPSVNTMLDESVVTKEDLYKAVSLNIPFVKFKLFKQGGIKELFSLINIALANHVKVVLGNGVATLLSNAIENSIYLDYKTEIFGASEANGFEKLVKTN